jgi:hypothetical protein
MRLRIALRVLLASAVMCAASSPSINATALPYAAAPSANAPVVHTRVPDEGSTRQLCSAFMSIREIDRNVNAALAGRAAWATTKDLLAASIKDSLKYYERAARLTSGRARTDVVTVSRFTAQELRNIESATSLGALGAKLASEPSAIRAGRAAERMNAFSRSRCGFAPRVTE